MKQSLWTIILVTGVFIGFLVGYSLSPMIKVGMIGNGLPSADKNSEAEMDMADFYRKLSSEAENDEEK